MPCPKTSTQAFAIQVDLPFKLCIFPENRHETVPLFTDTPLSLGDHELPEAQAHYISRVLRMGEGDAVQLFDGSGQEFRGTLLEVGKNTSACN